jgi:hypothetical protein
MDPIDEPPDAAGSPELRRPPSPSGFMFALAFAAVVVAGACGAVIGVGLVGVGCTGACSGAKGLAALFGAVAGAAGVGMVVVVVLRAQAEWRRQPNVSRRNPSA